MENYNNATFELGMILLRLSSENYKLCETQKIEDSCGNIYKHIFKSPTDNHIKSIIIDEHNKKFKYEIDSVIVKVISNNSKT